MEAQCVPIITERAVHGISLLARHGGNDRAQRAAAAYMRAESWNRVPIVRMTNISLLPGERR